MAGLGRVMASLKPAAPISKNLWAIMFVVGTAFMASRYDFQLSTLALPQFQRDLGLSEAQIAQIAAFAKLGAIPAVILTFTADKIGRKPLFLWAIIGFSASAILVALAQGPMTLALGLFLTRLFTMVDELLAVVILVEASPPAARAWLLGILSVCGAQGDAAALIAYGNFADDPNGWRWLYAAGALPALLSIFWRLGLKESAAFEAARDEGRLGPMPAIRANLKYVLLIGLAYFLFWLPISPALSLLSQFLQTNAGWSPGGVAALQFLAGALGLIGTIVGGGLADQFGRRAVAMVGTSVAGLGLAGVYLSAQTEVIAVAFGFGLFGWFAASVAMRALMTELVPTEARATVAGTTEIASTIGAFGGISAVGALIGMMGITTGVAVSWLLPLVALPVIALAFLPETKGKVFVEGR